MTSKPTASTPKAFINQLCQIEIPVQDLHRAILFYENVLGWRPAPTEIHDYCVLDVPADCPYGISLVPQRRAAESSPSSGPVIYFHCDDAAGLVETACQWGGRRRFGPRQLPGLGLIYQIEDPSGNRIGLYEKPETDSQPRR
jgi:predicted enzyme related to lactoylglutathione lyase